MPITDNQVRTKYSVCSANSKSLFVLTLSLVCITLDWYKRDETIPEWCWSVDGMNYKEVGADGKGWAAMQLFAFSLLSLACRHFVRSGSRSHDIWSCAKSFWIVCKEMIVRIIYRRKQFCSFDFCSPPCAFPIDFLLEFKKTFLYISILHRPVFGVHALPRHIAFATDVYSRHVLGHFSHSNIPAWPSCRVQCITSCVFFACIVWRTGISMEMSYKLNHAVGRLSTVNLERWRHSIALSALDVEDETENCLYLLERQLKNA